MSFDMSIIKKKTNVKQRIIDCKEYIRYNNLLTSNIKMALSKYVDFRFNKMQHISFTSNRLNKLVVDLLQYICDKDYKDITLKDVQYKESSILYEIKRAIYFGATKCLYNQGTDSSALVQSYHSANKIPVYFTRLTSQQLKSRKVVEEYFDDIERTRQ